MLTNKLLKTHRNELESGNTQPKAPAVNIPANIFTSCPSCKKSIFTGELPDNYYVCSDCGYHYRISARRRLSYLCDADTFDEHNKSAVSDNIIDFPGYDKKLRTSMSESSECESVITGKAKIGGHNCALFAMEPNFMMGSMGVVTGDKIASLFEYATAHSLPVVGSTVSGGARMQEGIFSLMQMAKVSGAAKQHSDAGNLYIVILTDPTMGGVTASFAMLGDIIIAEPKARIGFAGARVIEQTIRQKLPNGFQSSEFLLESGFIDDIVERKNIKPYVEKLLKFHSGRQVK